MNNTFIDEDFTTKNLYNTTLINGLREYNLDCLIPSRMSSYDDDEGYGHIGQMKHDYMVSYEDGMEYHYYDNSENELNDSDDFYDDDLAITDDNEYRKTMEEDSHVCNIDDLMFSFGYDYLTKYEFLDLEPWQLFHISKKQFKMIDFTLFDAFDIHQFFDKLAFYKNEFPSIEQRIKWATIATIVECENVTYCYEERNAFPGLTMEESNKIVNDTIKHLAIKLPFTSAVKKIQLYKDYVHFLPKGLIINQERVNNGVPPLKYPLKPKTSHIKDLHDKAYRDYENYWNAEATKNIEEINKGINEMVKSPVYRKFLYSDGKFSIIAPKDYDDFQREGKLLNHCIGDYASRFAEARDFIYFLRHTDNIDKPFYSIELLPNDNSMRKYSMTQCYTYGDSIDKDDETRDFILKWLRDKNINLKCDL